MKYFTYAALAAALCFTAQSNAQQYKFIAMDNSNATKLCVNAGSNDIKGVKRFLHFTNDIDKKKRVNRIICNDMSLAKFAFKYNAIDTYKYLNRYSNGRNKVDTSVTIKDVASVNSMPFIVYVSTAN